MASCCLRNFLLCDDEPSQTVYMAADECDAATNSQEMFMPLTHQGSNCASQQAQHVRDTLCKYFNGEGSLSGQEMRSLEL